MGLNHSEETHQRLVEAVPRCTGRQMTEWFQLMNDGPSFLRFDDRVRWLSSEYELAHGHALRHGAFGATSQRQRDRSAYRQLSGQLPGFRGAAEDQNAVGHHAC